MTFKLTSSAFPQGGEIPAKYTCEGQDISPPLAWTGAPPDATSLALIVDDPDAPDPAAPKMTWVHWVLYNIPPGTGSLPEGAKQLPPGTLQGLNDWKSTGYGGPCPPPGHGPHRYFFRLYALDSEVGLPAGASRKELERALEGHVLAVAELVGVYQR